MMETEEESYLLSEIIAITKDSKGKNFWLKAIATLGEGRVEIELGELKHQLRIGAVVNPAKYLTALLQKQMPEGIKTSANSANKKTAGEKLQTYFETTQLELFSELQPIKKPKNEEVEQQAMVIPYGKKNIPWTTFLSSAFFTLSTNKARSDKVLAKFRTLDGQVNIIPITRGRIRPGGKERGILTARHARILAALKNSWVQQGCSYYSYPNGAKICTCNVPARELSKLLKWSKFGGSGLIWLTEMVYDLKVIPYYLDLRDLGIKGLVGYGFSLLHDVTLVDGKKDGQTETVFHIEFSVPISVQLLHRHAVTKSKEMLTINSELATLLQLYLEPIVISLDGQEFSKGLKDIIVDLQLPKAAWHQKTSHRKKMFEKVIKELNSYRVADGRQMSVTIEKGLFDYMLIAKLVGTPNYGIAYPETPKAMA